MRVLVPYNESEQAEAALEYAKNTHSDDEIVLLHVLDYVEAGHRAAPEAALAGYWEEWYDEAAASGEELLAEASASVDTDVETNVIAGSPARAIVDFVEQESIDAVVIGSHGREGLSRILLGSVAETVVRRSPVPVTVVR